MSSARWKVEVELGTFTFTFNYEAEIIQGKKKPKSKKAISKQLLNVIEYWVNANAD